MRGTYIRFDMSQECGQRESSLVLLYRDEQAVMHPNRMGESNNRQAPTRLVNPPAQACEGTYLSYNTRHIKRCPRMRRTGTEAAVSSLTRHILEILEVPMTCDLPEGSSPTR